MRKEIRVWKPEGAMKFMEFNVLGRGEVPVNVDRISAVECLTEEPDEVKLADWEVQPVDDHGVDLYEESVAREAPEEAEVLV
jgi:hypothetical protein